MQKLTMFRGKTIILPKVRHNTVMLSALQLESKDTVHTGLQTLEELVPASCPFLQT